jgi:hypothetical protein
MPCMGSAASPSGEHRGQHQYVGRMTACYVWIRASCNLWMLSFCKVLCERFWPLVSEERMGCLEQLLVRNVVLVALEHTVQKKTSSFGYCPDKGCGRLFGICACPSRAISLLFAARRCE